MTHRLIIATSLVAIAALLAGCGGSQPPIGATGGWGPSGAVATHSDRGKSWMASGTAKIKKLLYVSYGDVVRVYDYATGKHVGTLSGFNSSRGLCVDKVGNVFLTSSSGSVGTVTEYAHGGNVPIKTFDTDGHAIGCSINPINGDLAVNNGIPAGGSDVEIWKGASGNPTSYSNQSDCYEMWPPGYDNHGNLYIETGSSDTVCEVPANSQKVISVPFNHHIGAPGGVMWDGKYLAFTDEEYGASSNTVVYQVPSRKVHGSLTVVGVTKLDGRGCGGGVDIEQPFIVGTRNTPANRAQGRAIVGANYACYSRTPVEYWHYPAGGNSFRHVKPTRQGGSGEAVSISS